MKAALISEIGTAPRLTEVDPPVAGKGEVEVEMVAAALNPADIAIGEGRFYAGHPPLPYCPGLEAVGRAQGRLVFALGGGLGVSRSGTLAERFVAPQDAVIELPESADPPVAAALGTAGLAGWLPITYRAQVREGESVLVLGATGTAGMVALQAARAAGAARVVAAGRNRSRLARLASLADETVSLEDEDLDTRLAAACSPGVDVVYDPLWGPPLRAALGVCLPGARVVHVGAAAADSVEIPSALVRGRRLSLLGYSNLGVPRPVLVDAYLEMVDRAIAGQLTVDLTALPLAEVGRAWQATKAGEGKYVLLGGTR